MGAANSIVARLPQQTDLALLAGGVFFSFLTARRPRMGFTVPAGLFTAACRSLTVPSTWNGMAVTAIAAEAFAGCGHLQTITIQKNIRSIADGAFAGCDDLQQIVIQSSVPSGCIVGSGLLSGTGADILVPADALSDYRTDYFWSLCAERILPKD